MLRTNKSPVHRLRETRRHGFKRSTPNDGLYKNLLLPMALVANLLATMQERFLRTWYASG